MQTKTEEIEEEPLGHTTNAGYNEVPIDDQPTDRSADGHQSGATPTPTRSLISPCSAFMIVLLLIRVVVGIVFTGQIYFGILFAVLAVLPTAVVGWWVLRAFRDSSVPNSFLVSQFLVGAVPLVFVAFVIEKALTAVSALPVFFFMSEDSREKILQVFGITKGINDDKAATEAMVQIFEELEKVPAWAIVLSIFLVAYVCAGMVEEIGKWLCARRFKGPMREAADAGRYAGGRTILVSTAMVALGFATTENIGYMLRMERFEFSGFPLFVFGLGLLRGLLAFPVHVGAQLHVAVAAAHRHIFKDSTRVSAALLHAILIHGTFDAVAFSFMALITLRKLPPWTGLLVPVVDLFLVVVLMLLVRARYKGLLERERVTLAEPV